MAMAGLSTWILIVPAILVLSCTQPSPTSASTISKAVAALAPAPGNETDGASHLEFKAGIEHDPTGVTISWDERVHFCQWKGVVCGRRHPYRVVELDLSSLGLGGSVSPFISNLTFLRAINLSDNQLYGALPQELGRLRRLRSLELFENLLTGEIPANLSSCLNLNYLNLGRNQFTGGFPGVLSTLPRLVEMSVYSNNLTGGIPPSVGNLSSLSVINFGVNPIGGSIPSELGRLTELEFLQVEENMLSGELPPSIYNLSKLRVLAARDNQLSGVLPSDIGTRLPRLEFFLVPSNHFEGSIPISLSNATSLVGIQLSRNRFTGTVPSNLGGLKRLERFYISNNSLVATEPAHWDFLTSLTNCTLLTRLSLQDNQLEGPLPNSIGNFSVNLTSLWTARNPLSGSIPEGLLNLRGLELLSMEGNQLTGNIPATLGMLENLVALNLQSNALLGEIPAALGNISTLVYLALGDNRLVGSIPKAFGSYRHLNELYLERNALNGTIPYELSNLFTVTLIYLHGNSLAGSLSSELGRLSNLHTLILSGNRLSGELPAAAIGRWRNMQRLSLAGNFFHGAIPPSLGDMKSLEKLDLSQNNLTGGVPQALGGLQFLNYLNLSFNDLEGAVPRNGVFSNASRVSLSGNRRLCGGISTLKFPACPSDRLVRKKKSKRFPLPKVVIPVGLSLIILLLVSLAVYFRRTRKAGQQPAAQPLKDRYQKISYNELLSATDGFSPNKLIGTGSFGSVYRGLLDGLEKPVAVKVLNLQRRGASKSFLAECEVLQNARHRNLVGIVTACSSIDFTGNDFKALVFDYMPNGSLDEWLHPSVETEVVATMRRALDFEQRLSIAIDVAAALEYLHTHCHTPIVHCDLKPSNVLLDDEMTAHVGDFGLARFLVEIVRDESESSTIGIKGTVGYVAPEYGVGGPVSSLGDVYSFGILLLELFTGKRPVDNMFKDGVSLRVIVEAALPDRAMEIMDPRLPQLEDEQEAMVRLGHFVSIMRVGLRCTEPSLRMRLEMGEVFSQLQAIKRCLMSR